MDHRVSGVDQAIVVFIGESKVRRSQVAAKDSHARLKIFVEPREIQMQLQRLPQTARSFLWVAGRPDHASFWDPPIFYPERNVASITYNLDAMFAQRLLRGGRPRRRPERRRMRVESRPSNG